MIHVDVLVDVEIPQVCTELCKCGDECENTDQYVVKGIDSDTDDDDNEE